MTTQANFSWFSSVSNVPLDRKFIAISFITDYVGFMKKVMRQMQSDYPMMSKVELELTQEKEMDALPIRPSKIFLALST